MSKREIKGLLGCLVIWAGSMAWADAPISAPAPSDVPANVMTPGTSNASVTQPPGDPEAVPAFKAPTAAPSSPPPAAKAPKVSGSGAGNAAGASKVVLADAFIAQNVLRVYLDRPASVTVCNSRGQQVVHLDSRRAMEAIPLQGITTGFIYLTVRTAQGELTKKLVYTGK